MPSLRLSLTAACLLACVALAGCSGVAQGEPCTPATTEPLALTGDGSRQAPLTLGAQVSSDEWIVVVNSVTTCADEAVAAQSEYNDIPDEGKEYILVNYTVTYLGPRNFDNPWIEIRFVPSSGEFLSHHTASQPPLPNFNLPENLLQGESRTGNEAIEVPGCVRQSGVSVAR